LCAIFALGSIVGRRAFVRRATFRLYPPTSILLLGQSGVGKSQSLRLSARVVAAASRDLSGFVTGHGHFTTSGLASHWIKIQEEGGLEAIEGIHVMDELSALLKETTGNENFVRWIIGALEHEDIEATTKSDGRKRLHNVTVAFGFGTTLAYLRETISVHQFGGGFMHRFVIANASNLEDRDEAIIGDDEIEVLGREAMAIRRQAPAEMAIEPAANSQLRAYRRQAEDSPHGDLDGFWNRYEGTLARLGMLLALSENRGIVVREDVARAERLVRLYLYPPLEALVRELAAGPGRVHLYSVAETITRAGDQGVGVEDAVLLLNATSRRQARDQLRFMTDARLIFESKAGRLYGTSLWRDRADHQLDSS